MIKRVMHPVILTILGVHYSILFAASASDVELNDRMKYLYLVSAGLFAIAWIGAIVWLCIHRKSDSQKCLTNLEITCSNSHCSAQH